MPTANRRVKNMTGKPFEFSEQIVINPGEDCNQGHFPEQAIVPGAYLISQIEAVLKQKLISEKMPNARIKKLKKVKFTAPFQPGDTAIISFHSKDGMSVTFKLHSHDVLILQGSALLAGSW